MSYQALYRKYRPSKFSDVIGQEHITKTLQNQIVHNKTSHAYLFCGTRGTGKTSTAKILAKAINCLSPVEGEPCDICQMCKMINTYESFNVIEIDAASNNGVDNIREIREEVKFAPPDGTYKVYIIDEVHMLSAGAFNALLKTLEEPPMNVVFILATTDPQKVPPTILSRCQRFDFKRILNKDMSKLLDDIAKKESLKVSDNVFPYISRLSDGAMRDALSILDRCISYYSGEEITLEKVMNVIGTVDDTILFKMSDAINEKNGLGLIKLLDEAINDGRDVRALLSDLTAHFRNMLISKEIGDSEELLNLSTETISLLKEKSKLFSFERLIYIIKQMSELDASLKYQSNMKISMEILFLKLCSDSYDYILDGLIQRIEALESGVFQTQAPVDKQEKNPVQQERKEETKVLEKHPNLDTNITGLAKIEESWSSYISKFSPSIMGFLMDTSFRYDGGNICTIFSKNPMTISVLKQKTETIQSGLKAICGDATDVDVRFINDVEQSKPRPAEKKADSEFDILSEKLPGIEFE